MLCGTSCPIFMDKFYVLIGINYLFILSLPVKWELTIFRGILIGDLIFNYCIFNFFVGLFIFEINLTLLI